jgi:hypothetical protein
MDNSIYDIKGGYDLTLSVIALKITIIAKNKSYTVMSHLL